MELKLLTLKLHNGDLNRYTLRNKVYFLHHLLAKKKKKVKQKKSLYFLYQTMRFLLKTLGNAEDGEEMV